MRIPLQPETRAVKALSLTITSLMVALGLLALAAAAALRHVDLDWRREVAGRWTVELEAPDPAQPASTETVGRLVAALRDMPGILQARAIEPDAERRLLQPWLGESASMADLPLPALIDIRVDPDRPPRSAPIAVEIGKIAPGATLDDHGAWLRDLVNLARTGEALGLTLLAVILLTIVLTVAASSRARLAINRPEIELLHVLGASDGYIADQFESSALRSAVAGAILGTLLAVAAGVALAKAGQSFAPLLPQLRLTTVDWAALAAVPIGAVLLAALVARSTARALARRLP